MDAYRGEPAFTPQGVLAMLATLLIWVGFLLSLRAENQSLLTPTDLALMRFGLPALLFLPLLWRRRALLMAIRWRYGAMLLLGGLPFFYLVSLGSGYLRPLMLARWCPVRLLYSSPDWRCWSSRNRSHVGAF